MRNFDNSYYDDAALSVLVGKTLTACRASGDRVEFECDDGTAYMLHHCQDCCETVTLDDVCGDTADLVGSPILVAEAVSNSDDAPKKDEYDESWTWTFYKFSTIKGSVTLRWYGTSNGYYSESVDFVVVP